MLPTPLPQTLHGHLTAFCHVFLEEVSNQQLYESELTMDIVMDLMMEKLWHCVYEETAVTVGYSCRLLSSSDTIETYVVDAESVETVRAQLISARDHMCQLLMAGQLVLDGLDLAPWMTHVMAAKCIGRSLVHTADVAHGSCAIVIHGHSLVLHCHLCYFTPRKSVNYCDEHVCLSV